MTPAGPSTAGTSNEFEETVWQWLDEDKWKDCDVEWQSIMNENWQKEKFFFNVQRRNGKDTYHIDLYQMTQKIGNKHRGGRIRELRQIGLKIILNNEGWVGERDKSYQGRCEEQWQVQFDHGWEQMASNLENQLSTSLDEGIKVVQATHFWTNPWGKSKTTVYSFDLEKMTQRNPDSNTTRPIRLVRVQIKQPRPWPRLVATPLS